MCEKVLCRNPNCEKVFLESELLGQQRIPEHFIEDTEYLCSGSFEVGIPVDVPEIRQSGAMVTNPQFP